MPQLFWQVKLWGLLNDAEVTPFELNSKTSETNLWQQLRCTEEWKQKPNVPPEIRECLDDRKVFWWFWRCYAQTSQAESEPNTSSADHTRTLTWNPARMTSALAGATAGYYPSIKHYFQEGKLNSSCPHVAVFTFSPMQALMQTSRTLEDVWAGAWLIHYLAAKICWKIAWKYGPDTLLYPCLYHQPLIDYWLLQQYPEFAQWIAVPSERERLAARFPDHLVMLLPDNGADPQATKSNPVWSAMIHAEQVLRQEWLGGLGQQVLAFLQKQNLAWHAIHPRLWEGWLEAQWQSDWVALPIGSFCPQQRQLEWATVLNQAVLSLKAVKQTQSWKFPTVFHLRSTLSGIGSAVRPIDDRETLTGETSLFDGTEALNATEVVWRGLRQILPDILGLNSQPQIIGEMSPASGWQVLMSGARDEIAAGLIPIKPSALKDNATCQGLLDFSDHWVPDLVEHRYTGQLLYARGNEILISTNLQDWDNLLWDIHQGFRGADERTTPTQHPCFTRGCQRTASFGLVIAQDSFPLPIALQSLASARKAATQHQAPQGNCKDAVQVCVLYGNGESLIATAKFDVFNAWRSLLNPLLGVQPTLFEQAADVWERHPAPSFKAIQVWVAAFCDRRSSFKNNKPAQSIFQTRLNQFLEQIWQTTQMEEGDRQVRNWLYLAAWMLQNRYIKDDSSLLMGGSICTRARKLSSKKLAKGVSPEGVSHRN